MASNQVTVDPLNYAAAITDPKTGNPSQYFQRQWELMIRFIGVTNAGLGPSGVTAGAYGPTVSKFTIPQFVVNTNGVITEASEETLAALLDGAFGSTEGDLLYRGATSWAALAAGTAGNVLQTNGPAAAPTWVTPSGGGGGATAARYWRIRGMRGVSGHSGDGFGLVLLNFRDSGGTALISVPGTLGFANATDTGSGWAVNSAFDGSSASGHGWYSGNGGVDGSIYTAPYVGYDMGTAVTPTTVEFAPITGFPWSVGSMVAIDYSTNRLEWHTLVLIDPRAGADNVVESYTIQ